MRFEIKYEDYNYERLEIIFRGEKNYYRVCEIQGEGHIHFDKCDLPVEMLPAFFKVIEKAVALSVEMVVLQQKRKQEIEAAELEVATKRRHAANDFRDAVKAMLENTK